MLPGQYETTPLTTPGESASVTTDYSRPLRAIGQDLSALFPRILVIETDGTNFTAQREKSPESVSQGQEICFQAYLANADR